MTCPLESIFFSHFISNFNCLIICFGCFIACTLFQCFSVHSFDTTCWWLMPNGIYNSIDSMSQKNTYNNFHSIVNFIATNWQGIGPHEVNNRQRRDESETITWLGLAISIRRQNYIIVTATKEFCSFIFCDKTEKKEMNSRIFVGDNRVFCVHKSIRFWFFFSFIRLSNICLA